MQSHELRQVQEKETNENMSPGHGPRHKSSSKVNSLYLNNGNATLSNHSSSQRDKDQRSSTQSFAKKPEQPLINSFPFWGNGVGINCQQTPTATYNMQSHTFNQNSQQNQQKDMQTTSLGEESRLGTMLTQGQHEYLHNFTEIVDDLENSQTDDGMPMH